MFSYLSWFETLKLVSSDETDNTQLPWVKQHNSERKVLLLLLFISSIFVNLAFDVSELHCDNFIYVPLTFLCAIATTATTMKWRAGVVQCVFVHACTCTNRGTSTRAVAITDTSSAQEISRNTRCTRTRRTFVSSTIAHVWRHRTDRAWRQRSRRPTYLATSRAVIPRYRRFVATVSRKRVVSALRSEPRHNLRARQPRHRHQPPYMSQRFRQFRVKSTNFWKRTRQW